MCENFSRSVGLFTNAHSIARTGACGLGGVGREAIEPAFSNKGGQVGISDIRIYIAANTVNLASAPSL